jgi:hypothetical protein
MSKIMNAICSCHLRIQRKHIASIIEVAKHISQNTSIHPGKIHHAFMEFLHIIRPRSVKNSPLQVPDTSIFTPTI